MYLHTELLIDGIAVAEPDPAAADALQEGLGGQFGEMRTMTSPSHDGTELSTAVMPEGVPVTIAPERREEFSPGLDPELLALVQATAAMEIKTVDALDTTAAK